MNALLHLENHRSPFSVHTFPCATNPCVFPHCHAFKLWDVNTDYAIFTVNTCIALYLDQKNPVSWHETQSLSGPWCPSLSHCISCSTWNRFFSSSDNSVWVPESSTSRKQTLVTRRQNAGTNPANLVSLPVLSPIQSFVSVTNYYMMTRED